MLCTSPTSGWQKQGGGITRSLKDAWIDKPLTIRCGNCKGCRKTKALNWGIRCLHESKFHEQSCFINPTFNDENLPLDGSLRRFHVQQLVRAMRDAGNKFRYQFAGEYGPKTNRPHYHGSLFGYRPDDLELVRDGEEKLYRSPTLEKIWGKGKIDVGEFSLGTALYISQYVLKKITGKAAPDAYQKIDPETGEVTEKLPPFQLQSNRPGLGEEWIKKYATDVYPADYVVIDGKKFQPPTYYDKKCAELYPTLWQQTFKNRLIKEAAEWKTIEKDGRKVRIKTTRDDYKGSDRHLIVREKIQISQEKTRDGLE